MVVGQSSVGLEFSTLLIQEHVLLSEEALSFELGARHWIRY